MQKLHYIYTMIYVKTSYLICAQLEIRENRELTLNPW